MFEILEFINGFVWGVPALTMILGVGIYLSVKTNFFQIRYFSRSVSHFLAQFKKRNDDASEVSPYRALCTALSATVGTGNLAGVAGAICVGGPGAIFWMWICGILGMITKFAEITLATRYRTKNVNGEYIGGPMLMIKTGMPERWHYLAYLYAFMGIVASFGVGNATQVSSMIDGIEEALEVFGVVLYNKDRFFLACGIAVLILVLLMGGARRIGRAAECIVPFAAAGYIMVGAYVLLVKWDMIPNAFAAILKGAFAPKAVTGGVIGSMFTALRAGTARGVFTNEAGMGTAAIAHASANSKHPVQQGLLGIMEVFLDTIVICTVTALVILCSGVPIPYGVDTGIKLTSQAFSIVCGSWISIPISLALCAFALATILGWGLYGLRCAQFLFGEEVLKRFVVFQTLSVIVAAVLKTNVVWIIAEIVNGLMAIPNLLAVFSLTPVLVEIIKKYEKSGTVGTVPEYINSKEYLSK